MPNPLVTGRSPAALSGRLNRGVVPPGLSTSPHIIPAFDLAFSAGTASPA